MTSPIFLACLLLSQIITSAVAQPQTPTAISPSSEAAPSPTSWPAPPEPPNLIGWEFGQGPWTTAADGSSRRENLCKNKPPTGLLPSGGDNMERVRTDQTCQTFPSPALPARRSPSRKSTPPAAPVPAPSPRTAWRSSPRPSTMAQWRCLPSPVAPTNSAGNLPPPLALPSRRRAGSSPLLL